MDSRKPLPEVPGWDVRRELGRGGSSTVWLVADAEGTEAALKVPDREVDTPAELLGIELRAVGELTHDHLVRPLGVARTDRGPGLLSEYYPGGSLGALVRATGPLPIGQVVTVLVPVAQALQALHDHGVVHGDLSPGNILFTVQGRPGVADLGSSRLLGGPSHRTGTPGFSAPELDVDADRAMPRGQVATGHDASALPSSGLDPAADIYSMAAVGWFALTGRAPARTSSRAPLPLIVPDIPRDVVELLEAGLDEDPANRPSAERFAMACYRWATPEPVDLYPAASPEVAMELPTRRRDEPGERRRHRPGALRSGKRSGGPRSSRRTLLLAGGAAIVLAAAAGLGLLWPHAVASAPDGPHAAPSMPEGRTAPSTSSVPRAPGVSAAPPSAGMGMEEVSEAAVALGPARTKALTSLDRRHVEVYSLQDSPALAADVALQEELEARKLHYEGLSLETRVVGTIEHADASTANVPIELTIDPYRTVADSGETVAEAGSPTVERFTARMERTAGGWRVREILP